MAARCEADVSVSSYHLCSILIVRVGGCSLVVSRLGINYEWWLKSLHGTVESCINGTHSYMPERAALAGEVTGILCDSFSNEHFVRYL